MPKPEVSVKAHCPLVRTGLQEELQGLESQAEQPQTLSGARQRRLHSGRRRTVSPPNMESVLAWPGDALAQVWIVRSLWVCLPKDSLAEPIATSLLFSAPTSAAPQRLSAGTCFVLRPRVLPSAALWWISLAFSKVSADISLTDRCRVGASADCKLGLTRSKAADV